MVPKTCSIEGCEKPSRKRGMCHMHYARLLRHGDPFAGNSRHSTPEESFTSRIERRGECLIWTGSITPGGYGQLWVDGRLVPSHRFAWERSNGPIPEGMVLDHTCRNRACSNADHLRIATQKQNSEHVGLSSGNRSGFRGVFWSKNAKKWRAIVMNDGKSHHAGYFSTPEAADEAARSLRNDLFTHNDLDRKKAA